MYKPFYWTVCAVFLIFCIFLDVTFGAQGFTEEIGKDKVRLTDISTLTLYNGRYTTGRRSAPVPQIQCVGGTAGCSQYLPSVVQCYNKGSDGVDVQWECKADLDNRVKLGAIEVVCEGYDYPDDPYILKGSCGLEYQLNVKDGSGARTSDSSWKPSTKNRGFVFSDLIILVIAGVIMYALYKTCLTTPQYSSTNSDYPDGRPGSYGSGSYPSAPPPPYSSGYSSQDYSGADCHGSSDSRRRGGGGGGNFWAGAATGGILGYLFGNRNTGGSYYGGGSRYGGYNSERNSNWGWGGGGGGGSGGGGSFSSGTSTSTSFGGTRRR